MVGALLALSLLMVGLLGVASARRRPRKARNRPWIRILTKKRFGTKPRSGRRSKWVGLGRIRVTGKKVAILGKKVKVRGKLTRGGEFYLEIRMLNGTLLVDESTPWKGRYMRITVTQSAKGLTARLKTTWRWRKWRRPGKKRRRRR